MLFGQRIKVRQRIKLGTKHTLTKKQAILGVAAGVVLGLIVAAIMTTLDWRLNPGGIFYNAQGTKWGIVGETAFSWFLPVGLAGSVVAVILLILLSRPK